MKALLILLMLSVSLVSIKAQEDFSKEPLAAYKAGGVWYFIDHEGNELFPYKELEDVGGYSSGYFRVLKNVDGKDTWMFLDKKGEIAFIPECSQVTDFIEGMAICADILPDKSYLYGFIDSTGRLVIPKEYNDVIPFSEGIAYVMNRDRRGYIDKRGNMKLSMNDLVGYTFSEGLAAVSDKNYKCGYMDRTGLLVIPRKYDEPWPFKDSLAQVTIDGLFGYINMKGDTVIPLKFDDARNFSEDRAFVGKRKDTQTMSWAPITKDGTVLSPYYYDQVHSFSEGLASCRDEDGWVFIDKSGKKVFDKHYNYAGSFKNGLAWVKSGDDGIYGFINHKGELVVALPVTPDKVVDLRLNEAVN